ncbi:CPS_collapsed_G0003640.mRNA.1.CDS.1 [Saccharomyces cerevisiae]|nr:CPS_collapsed_G0003640.mRNA.1.CDS.1 [Saccharomyces cerevisiae]
MSWLKINIVKVLQQLGCLYGMSNVQFQAPSKKALDYLKSQQIIIAAYDAFQQAVNRDSRNPIFWCSIGVLYYQISQYRDALDAYTRAIRLNPYISEV